MPREFKSIYRTKANDIYIRVDKVITPCKCIVTNCKETDCYDIQFEQPEGCSFMGGTFCQKHIEDIFNEYPTIIERCLEESEKKNDEDAINRILKRMWNCRGKHTTSIDKVRMEQIIRDELSSVNQQESILDKIKSEINSPNRGTCDYFIVDRIEEIINEYAELQIESEENQ